MSLTDATAVLLRAQDGSSVRIDRFPVVLGRFHPQAAAQPDCDLSLLDPEGRISRRHLEIDIVDGELVVSDLGSTNGTWLDGRRLAAHERSFMGAGGELTLGNVAVTFELESAAAASPAPQAAGGRSSGEPTIVLNPPPPPAPDRGGAGSAGMVAAGEPVLLRAQGEPPPPPQVPGPAGAMQSLSVLRAFADPAVTQLVASPGRLPRIEKGGRWMDTPEMETSAVEWEELVTQWEGGAGAVRPLDVALLDEGLLVELLVPPAVAEPTLLAQRRPGPLNLDGMLGAGQLDAEAASILRLALAAGEGIVVTGPPASGRTSLIGALVDSLPPLRRTVVVERRPTVRFTSPHAVRLRRPRQDGGSPVALGLALEPAWLVIDDADPADASEAARRLVAGGCSCVVAARTPDPDRWRRISVDALAASVGDAGRASSYVEAVFPLTVRLAGHREQITPAAISRP